jgi:hypothetical protein
MAQTNYNMGKLGIQVTANTQQAATQLQQFARSMRSTETQSKQTTYAVQKMAGSLGSLKSIIATNLGFGSLQQGLNTLKNAFSTGAKEAIEFVENYNLFNVSMRGNVEEQLKFQYALNNAFKTNMSETLRYQGFFANLSSSLGITNEATDVLSQNLTKLTYDLSSLFNVDVATIYSKLQSGIVGQTKPLRTLGIDVTMQTLQPYLDRFGIDKKVTELTQAEKVLLRYIAILDQSQNAQGDFARTIETSANQLRILKLQTQEMARWFGTMLEPAIRTILPYLNALVMTFKEIFKWISLAMGFDLSEFNFLGEIDGGEAQEEIEGVNNSVEKLKKSLYGFDEINNMTTSFGTDFSGLDGYSSTYEKLQEQMKKFSQEYDNLMEGVQMKADTIAQTILEWLGFTQVINEETGEISYKYEGVGKTLENVFGSVMNVVYDLQLAVSILTGYFSALIILRVASWLELARYQITLLAMAMKTGTLSMASFNLAIAGSAASLAILTGGMAVLIYSIIEVSKIWGMLSGAEQAIAIFSSIAAAAMAAALAIAVFHTSWTVGIGAAAIAGGLALLATSFAMIEGKSKELSKNTQNSVSIGGGSYQAPVMPSFDYGSNYIPQTLTQSTMNLSNQNNQNTQTTVNINLDDVLVGSAIIDSVNRAGASTGKTIMAIE